MTAALEFKAPMNNEAEKRSRDRILSALSVNVSMRDSLQATLDATTEKVRELVAAAAAAGVSENELHKLVGVSRPTIAVWTGRKEWATLNKDQKELRFRELVKAAAAAGVSEADLQELTGASEATIAVWAGRYLRPVAGSGGTAEVSKESAPDED